VAIWPVKFAMEVIITSRWVTTAVDLYVVDSDCETGSRRR